MLKVTQKELKQMESQYSGIIEQIQRFENAILLSCPLCRSKDTANVEVGIIGRTINIAAATTKLKPVPNGKGKLGKYICNKCEKFFD